MTNAKAEASRKNAKNAMFVTHAIKRYKKQGLSHEEAARLAKEDLETEKAAAAFMVDVHKAFKEIGQE